MNTAGIGKPLRSRARNDAENDEAERYPLGPKEFWRSRLVGKATYGTDSHPMTDAEFETDWDESRSQ